MISLILGSIHSSQGTLNLLSNKITQYLLNSKFSTRFLIKGLNPIFIKMDIQ
jgi:hypothetical protein